MVSLGHWSTVWGRMDLHLNKEMLVFKLKLVSLVLVCLCGCDSGPDAASKRDMAERNSDKDSNGVRFLPGHKVRVKLDGRIGTVLSTEWDRLDRVRKIRVRVVSPQATTAVRLIGADGPVKLAPYAIVDFYRFELEHVESDADDE